MLLFIDKYLVVKKQAQSRKDKTHNLSTDNFYVQTLNCILIVSTCNNSDDDSNNPDKCIAKYLEKDINHSSTLYNQIRTIV